VLLTSLRVSKMDPVPKSEPPEIAIRMSLGGMPAAAPAMAGAMPRLLHSRKASDSDQSGGGIAIRVGAAAAMRRARRPKTNSLRVALLKLQSSGEVRRWTKR